MADFLTGLNKNLEKAGFAVGDAAPPQWWVSTGNYVLNKIISGHFDRGIPQGRLTALTGPSQSGKSFLLCNIMREAQKQNCMVVALDSENALDDDFVSAIGVNVDDGYTHVHVSTISDVTAITSSVITGYKKEYGTLADGKTDAPRLLLAIDSLDMLITDTESDNYNKKGIIKGDQGQKNKQLKAMLRELVHAIKNTNITIVVNDQVYKNQDLLNGEGVWLIKDAVKFSLSQIVLLTKLKLKNDTANPRDVTGIKMKCESYKSRFSQPAQSVTIEVPYSTGMDPYNGLLAVAKGLGIVEQGGAWYTFNGTKFQAKTFVADHAEDVLKACEELSINFIEADLGDGEEIIEKQETRKEKIKNKLD